MIASGVIGSILSAKGVTVNATTVNNGISVASINKGQVVNVTSALRVRAEASTSSSVLGTMRNGTTFDIVSKSGNWYEIKFNGKNGFIYGDYVKEITNSSAVSTTGKVVNVTSNLRVRSGASTSSTVLGYITNNTSVSILGTEGQWYKIKYNSGYGYVHKDYISVNGSSSNNTSGGNKEDDDLNYRIDEPVQNQVNKTGYVYNVSSGGLRVRKEASTSSTVLGTLYSGNSVNIIGESRSWYKISYNSSTAYVHKDYITETKPSSGNTSNNVGNSNSTSNGNSSSSEAMNETGVIVNVSTNLRVRKEASSSSFVLGYLLNNQSVNIIGKEGNWYKIKFNGATGYVSSDYVKITNGNSNNGSSNGSSNGNNSNIESVSNSYEIVLEAMKSQIGSPYAYGAAGELVTRDSINSLKGRFPSYASQGKYDFLEQFVDSGLRAFDCSGLMQWAFAKVNINIGRSTYNQINAGIEVAISDINPGDLLFDNALGHVAMYIGNGQWIESPNSGKTVRITNVRWESVQRARRVL